MCCRSWSTNAAGAWRAVSAVLICSAILRLRVAVGAKGSSTGSNVVSLTSSTIRGRQNRTVAYHGPSDVVPRSSSRAIDGPARRSSFLVARTISTRPSSPTYDCDRPGTGYG